MLEYILVIRGKQVYLDDLVTQLDLFFNIDRFQPDLPFSHLVPQVYAETGIEIEIVLESTFLERFYGLMAHNKESR
ncbi:MAG: hypothetical protein GY832_04160 [Chloroflexi bacterium]|nr:hypothetical protein [Chloroflexota bacterium]